MATEQFSNDAQTTLAAALGASATSLTVTSAGTFPSSPQFRVQIGSELLLVTGLSGPGNTTWDVTRGQEGTTPAAHIAGADVIGVLTAGAMSALTALTQ